MKLDWSKGSRIYNSCYACEYGVSCSEFSVMRTLFED